MREKKKSIRTEENQSVICSSEPIQAQKTKLPFSSENFQPYDIVQTECVESLKKYVNRLMNNYVPVGAPFCRGAFWYQAVMRKD